MMGWWLRTRALTCIPHLSLSSSSFSSLQPPTSSLFSPCRNSRITRPFASRGGGGGRRGGRGMMEGNKGWEREGNGAEEEEGKIFVSNYYEGIEKRDVLDYLQNQKIAHTEGTGSNIWAVVKYCFSCPPHNNKPDNLWKVNIYKRGQYHCHRCSAHGSWFDFKKKLASHNSSSSAFTLEPLVSHQDVGANLPTPSISSSTPSPPPKRDVSWLLSSAKLFPYELEYTPSVLSYLTDVRQLSLPTLSAYKVGACQQKFGSGEEQDCVTFPWYAPNQKAGEEGEKFELKRAKIRSIEEKKNMRLFPAGAGWGFFGLHLVPDDAKSIIITEGEYDAMAVYQATGIPAISLTNGASSLPVETIPLLERFEEIILWMDNDVAGQTAAQKFAKKLGVTRCKVVQELRDEWGPSTADGKPSKPKDANDALRTGWDLKKIIEGAEHIPNSKIATLRDYKSFILRELQDPLATGRQSKELPTLSKLLKGFRPGELTIFSGASGIGKTTFLSQMSLEFCAQGESTLWGSFEIQNHRLLTTMMKQFHRVNSFRLLERFEDHCNAFQDLPLYFLRYHGSTNIQELLEVIEFAVYKYDVSHIVLDNLQFMVSGQAYGFDKFEHQDRVVSLLRQFATTKNVHITLVLHPRKLQENERVTMGSLFGSAKSVQEADNVIVLQNDKPGMRHLEVLKNRYDGDLGRIPIHFRKEHLRFLELEQVEAEARERQQQREKE